MRRMVLAVLAAAVVEGCTGLSGGSPPAPTAPPTASTSPSPIATEATAGATAVPGVVKARISLTHPSSSIDVGPEGVWLLAPDGHVLAIDRTTNALAADVEINASEFGYVAVGAGSVWATDFDHDTLWQIDPATETVREKIGVGTNPEGLLVTADTVWVSNHRAGSICKVDTATSKVVATFTFGRTGTSGPKGIVIADGDVWTSVPNTSSVYRLNPETGDVVAKLFIAQEEIGTLQTDGRFVYLPNGGMLSRIDPATNTIVHDYRPEPFPMTFAHGTFWAVSGRSLVRLDLETLEPAGSWQLVADSEPELDPWDLAFDDQAIWLLDSAKTVLRIEIPA
jgi:YVTN family beta-propeller protein